MTQSPGAEWWRPAGARAATLPRAPGSIAGDSPVPFAALLVFVVVLMLAPNAFVPGVGRVRLALLTGVFAVAAHCWTRYSAGRPLMAHSRETWLVGALLGWMILTLPLSQSPAASLVLFDDYLKTLGVFWLLSNTVTTQGRLRAVAWTLSLTAVPLAVTSIRNFLADNVVRGRIVGFNVLTSDPNALAMVLNLILPLTVALFLISRTPMVRGVLITLMALDVGAVVVTFSRGGFLTLAAIFVLYLRTLQRWRRWRWVIAALVLATAAVPLLPAEYLDRLGTITNIQADTTGAAQERWELTQAGLQYVKHHPLFGAGLGMNVIADCERRGVLAENCASVCAQPLVVPCLFVHNVYLQYAMDLGWPGLALFLLLLATSARGAAWVRDRCAAFPALRELAPLSEAVRIAIIAFALAGLFYPWAYFLYFYLFAALAVAAGAIYKGEARAAAPALTSP